MRYIVARYSVMNYRGNFQVEEEDVVAAGDHCLIRSPRGIELGKVLCDPIEYNGTVTWVKGSRNHEDGRRHDHSDALSLSGTVLRQASDADREKVSSQRRQGTEEEVKFCNSRIEANNLKMNLVGVEYLFDGEKIIFYFLAEGRVDFRALVRDLAKKYRTRIEMKQIGVRDEARLLADYEHCGRPLCCKSFLGSLEPVTMKMAKCQKTTLDPSKISGRCGRLMCCLRFEDHVYQDLIRRLPRRGAVVRLKSGRASVLSQDILLQKVAVETESRQRMVVHTSEIIEVVSPDRRPQRGPKQGNKGDEAVKKGEKRPEKRRRARKRRSR